MFPFTIEKHGQEEEKHGIKKEEVFETNAKYLLHLFKYVNFNNEKIETKTNGLNYSSFCNAFTIYLSMIIVGFTKIMFSVLDETNSTAELRKNFEEHTNTYFKKEYIIQFYSKISSELLSKLEDQTEIQLDYFIIEEQAFVDLCKHYPFIINYFQLREEYIQFVKLNILDKKENNSSSILDLF